MYSVVYYPKIDTSKIQDFRKKYDPLVGLIGPHLTLIFYIPDTENIETVIKHVAEVANQTQPFKIHLKGLVKAWDQWLFLTLTEGNKEVVNLHDALYSGVLAKYLRKDIEYIPHVAIGLFAKKNSRYSVFDPTQVELDNALFEKALIEANELNLDYACDLDEVSLIKLDKEKTRILSEQKFKLGRNWGEL